MPGDTGAVCVATLRVQWDSHSSYASICTHWSISKDQLVRLRDVLPLPLRHDRRLRVRHEGIGLNPSPAEQEASESSLALAPLVAARATCVSFYWTDAERESRQVTKPTPFFIVPQPTPDEFSDGDERESG